MISNHQVTGSSPVGANMEKLVYSTTHDFHRTEFNDGQPGEVIIRCDNGFIIVVKTLDGVESETLVYASKEILTACPCHKKSSRLVAIGPGLSFHQVLASIETLKSFDACTPPHIVLGILRNIRGFSGIAPLVDSSPVKVTLKKVG